MFYATIKDVVFDMLNKIVFYSYHPIINIILDSIWEANHVKGPQV